MSKFKNKYRIESTRLKDWDYSTPSSYFITIVTNNRKHLFGKINNGEMILNDLGKIVNDCWSDLPNHYGNIVLDEFVIMPNHIHSVIIITENETNNIKMIAPTVETGLRPVSTINNISTINNNANTKQHGLSEFIRALKSFSSRKINELLKSKIDIWQPRFYDHIIRSENELQNIRQYIKNNPLNWNKDDYNRRDAS